MNFEAMAFVIGNAAGTPKGHTSHIATPTPLLKFPTWHGLTRGDMAADLIGLVTCQLLATATSSHKHNEQNQTRKRRALDSTGCCILDNLPDVSAALPFVVPCNRYQTRPAAEQGMQSVWLPAAMIGLDMAPRRPSHNYKRISTQADKKCKSRKGPSRSIPTVATESKACLLVMPSRPMSNIAAGSMIDQYMSSLLSLHPSSRCFKHLPQAIVICENNKACSVFSCFALSAGPCWWQDLGIMHHDTIKLKPCYIVK